MWKLNNSLLNEKQAKTETEKRINDFLKKPGQIRMSTLLIIPQSTDFPRDLLQPGPQEAGCRERTPVNTRETDGKRQVQEHKQQKSMYFGIIRTQFSYHSNPKYPNTPENHDADLKIPSRESNRDLYRG